MSRLVGRQAELAALLQRTGEGGIVLLSGEAGVGKTRLAAEVAAAAGAVVLRGAATHGGTAPYGPLVAALRSHLHANPGGLDGCGPLRAQLALLLPELGDPAPAADRPTLFEALRCAFAHVAGQERALVVLDDLQWSDEATLEVLSALAEPRVLVIAAYRSDGLPRRHGLRRLRNDLRRAGRLDEVVLRPLDLAETAELLAQALDEQPAPSLAGAIHDRTEGIPFFVEELAAAALRLGGAADDLPLPDTVRDAVLVGAAELSADARAAAEVAAVAGETFDLDLVAAHSSEHGLSELLESGLVHEDTPARFRHALTREALYADVPWMRRRALHRALAEALQRSGAQSREVARHWLGARAAEQAREALLQAAAESEAVHAYRDAAAADRQALDLWPDGDDDDSRAPALERYARCSRLAGDPSQAARALREL
ncbi:MAG: ATP-binding protein, partial [Solirubrobacteraceae bacterium]